MIPIDAHTRLCAVIGKPVSQSLSPAIHNAAFAALGLNYSYSAFEIEDVAAFLTELRAMPSFRGVSVTIPHKLAVIPHLDELDPMAARVGSVNTITNDNGRLIGATTDGPGALRAFAREGIDLAGKRVLFLGAGGAVRAVACAVADTPGVERVTLLARDPAKADALATILGRATGRVIEPGSLASDLAKALMSHDVIVNGTPVGMTPKSVQQSPIPSQLLRPDHVVFDMVYKPNETRLIREAKAAGCQVVYGIEMLIEQAALQFKRWTGLDAPIEIMRAAAMGAAT
ncbi:MAG: shikimate dehydrogenase [Candidatus Hydrogenedentota bacterium]